MSRICPHRIGKEIEFNNATNPNTLWPTTTWTQITDGRVTLASSNSHTLGNTGGSESESYTPGGSVDNHWLTNDEIPKHTHGVPAHTHDVTGGVNDHAAISISSSGGHDHTVTVYYNTKKLASGTAQPLVTAGGASSNNSVAQIASGSGKHTHSVPQHGHTHNIGVSGGATTTNEQGSGGGAHNHGFTGTGATISHMQPWRAVNKWRRTA